MSWNPLPLLVCLPALAVGEDWTWNKQENRVLELNGKDGPVVVRFVLDAAPRDPHFEILATADGRNTVWVGPDDHVWHYGLWFSWKYINEVNFWETNPATGRQQGTDKIHDPEIEIAADGAHAVIRYRQLAHPGPEAPAVLEDRVEIRVTRPRDGLGPQVNWTITTTALADVTLDRTPLPGEPNGRDWGGYAGFSWRGASGIKDIQFTDSEGRQDADIHRQSARRVNINGTLDGRPFGILLQDKEGNPGHPLPWYITSNPKIPFWFASPSPLLNERMDLPKGGSFRHSYRAIVHDGPVPVEDLLRE